ncbi:MAG: TIGR03936 family radical SAM-associated protein, partial [Clostridiales bacterium]|nr:TIGR03936 family radical SAM-associated protein [Clostridiales bacterium]
MLTIKYKKIGNSVFISHIDILRTVLRGIRRAGLNIAYSNGFNPHAELYLSPPLPLFVQSLCEYFSADTNEDASTFFEKYSLSSHPDTPPISVL